MAQKVITLRVSDLSGEELGENGTTINFSVGSDQYEIDLSDKEAGDFYDTLKKYTDVATKTGGRGRRSSGGSSRRSGGSGRSKEELSDIREWAKQNDWPVSERGRIKQEVIDAYDAAMNALKS